MAQAVIVCLWCAICLATEQTVPTERKITRSSVRAFSLNQRVSRLKDINEYLLLYLISSLTFVCTQHVLLLRFEVIGSCNAWKLCVIFYDGPYRILRCNIIGIHIYLYPCRWASCDRWIDLGKATESSCIRRICRRWWHRRDIGFSWAKTLQRRHTNSEENIKM